MPDDRWEQVKLLFELAMDCDLSERDSFLVSRCGSDLHLKREVESLLASQDGTDDFLETPCASLRSFLEPEKDLGEIIQSGVRLGAYRIEAELGHGGMGSVYLASRADDEYKKQVAIKLIRYGTADGTAVRRFRNERQILASLEHPYVARLLDGGTTAEGLPYFVMEYVDGCSLHDYCVLRKPDERQKLELFLRICAALDYAHRRSVVHRDIKPGNILVQQDGSPKLLDFGIAKLLAADAVEGVFDATGTGIRALTPAYASPEQLQGLPATVCSDIYALTVVLFELLTGERPLRRSLRQALSADEDAPGGKLSADLKSILLKGTRWEPAERYQSVEELAADLHRYLNHIPVCAGSPAPEVEQTPPPAGSLAILPFQMPDKDTSTDAYLGPGITDALITRLARVSRISVRPTSAVAKYVHDGDRVRAARELHVRYVLEGRIRTAREFVRVSVQLVSTETQTPVWAATFDEPYSDLLKLEDSISEQVVRAIIPQLTGEEQRQLARRGTANAKAYESYLRGRWHQSHSELDPANMSKALLCFMEALAEDPDYAMAHAGVADYYISLGAWGGLPPAESFAAAKDSAARALALDPASADAHVSLGVALWAYDGAVEEAEQHFHLAITRNPDTPQVHFWSGLLNASRNRPELAIASLEQACKLSPGSGAYVVVLATCYYHARRYGQSVEILEQCIRDGHDSPLTRERLAFAFLLQGNLALASENARLSAQMGSRYPGALRILALVEAAGGNRRTAVEIASELEQQCANRYISSYLRAVVQLAVGSLDRCFELLEQSRRERDWWFNWACVDPVWDSLRSDDRFVALTTAGSVLLPPVGMFPSGEPRPARAVPQKRSGLVRRVSVLAAAALVVVSLLLWLFSSQPAPYGNTQITKVTSNGTALATAISPDGKLIAYAVRQNGQVMFNLKSAGQSTGPKQLGPPMDGEIRGLVFTRNGKYLSFENFRSSQPSLRTVKLIPIGGGADEQLPGTFTGPTILSPSGRYVAYLNANGTRGQDELWIENADGTHRRLLTALAYPRRFSWDALPGWSEDESTLACALEGTDRQGFYISLVSVNTRTGAVQNIRSPRWQWVQEIKWLSSHRGLVVIGQEHESSFQQIWFVPYRRGEARRITNDLNDYAGVSTAAANTSLVSVQVQTLSNIYVMPNDHSAATQITPGSGRYFDLAWTPDGNLLYASDATGSADLWLMNAAGREQRQLTFDTGRSYAPAASPDGKTIAFHSNRSGMWNIWKMADGAEKPVPLTADLHDSNWPQFTPDGTHVVYHHTGSNGMWNLWSVPVAGGAPQQLTRSMTTHPAVSRHDGKIACWYSAGTDHPQWKLAILPPGGGEPLRFFELAGTVVPDSNIRWTNDGKAVTFLDGRNGASNVWLQPLDGTAARPLTSFASGQIYSFDWSYDGKLAFSRGISLSDVVLIRERKH